MKNYVLVVLFTMAVASALHTYGQKRPELAPAPPMGWNSWNWFGKQEINEKIVYEVIDAMVDNGLRDAGYEYVVIDGGWRDTILSPEGKLLAHPVKFPGGIKPLAAYAHERGLKFGLHTVPGTHDCGGDEVGGFGREELHIQQFVDWGVDFVKVDLCRHADNTCDPSERTLTGWCEELVKPVYEHWSKLLHHCGRDITFSISAYKLRDWDPELSNMSRTTHDIQSRRQKEGAIFHSDNKENKGYLSVMACAEINNQHAKKAGNGYWNDPDMLVVGDQGLTEVEQETHFALWSIISAPLMLGNDPRNMSDFEKKLILNKEIIAVNQDPHEQGYLLKEEHLTQIWKKQLSNGDLAVLAINVNPSESKEVSINLIDIGRHKNVVIKDIIHNDDMVTTGNKITRVLKPHECAFLVISEK
jgi:alpha-galactosidase